MCMRRVMLPSVACLAPPYSSTLSHMARFSETSFEHKVCVLVFSTTIVRNIFHPKNN